ncbi:NAD(P)/FAD-dependent oxidoreductase [Thiothrix winogradskyi]|uniref:NAD(P)/FAD-dependent oxidoreductase n=1 Tax=Thiothrix winogradskyi TaxID=96472 RepID=A0ABY3T2M9_9GAMM|nr:NAD(P)/FAD-dependent oxidoreductase [Thiothrix winogradskyi]UJS25469.1 NAD(P)/FAD-dependent oxidoreductase [Thiothrix winogradskyi]
MHVHIAEGEGLHRIVIVGGGAGGLELATLLGKTLGKQQRAHITLVDKNRTHIWKPMLHEIASGSMDYTLHEIDYLAQARWHHFRYRIGAMTGVDRSQRLVFIDAHTDEDGITVTPPRSLPYDTLVVAIGSRTHDFNIPGVAEHAIQLDTAEQAERFHRKLVNAFIRANAQAAPLQPGQLQVAIIGAGATGVELAAELHKSVRTLVDYGLERLDADRDVNLNLIEAAPRILPALPERIADEAMRILQKLEINVRTDARVAGVKADGVELASGEFIPAELVVWAAGIRSFVCLQNMDNLAINNINQLLVKPTLQTTLDDNVFAFGDCAAAPWLGKAPGTLIPPRAQAAHQQALHLAKQLRNRVEGKPLQDFHYQDFGSLISLGENWAAGGLMGNLSKGTLFVEGYIARFMYNMLYKKHQLGLHGFWKVALDTVSGFIRRKTTPRIKLH